VHHVEVKKLKVKRYTQASELGYMYTGRHLPYGITVYLPATRHKWTRPALIPARKASTWLTYPGRMEGSVDLVGWLHTEMMYLPADSHPSKY